jgi:hypothetical protein
MTQDVAELARQHTELAIRTLVEIATTSKDKVAKAQAVAALRRRGIDPQAARSAIDNRQKTRGPASK